MPRAQVQSGDGLDQMAAQDRVGRGDSLRCIFTAWAGPTARSKAAHLSEPPPSSHDLSLSLVSGPAHLLHHCRRGPAVQLFSSPATTAVTVLSLSDAMGFSTLPAHEISAAFESYEPVAFKK